MTARRLSKILIWALPTLVCLYLTAKVFDSVWFWTKTPTEFQNANWCGEWRTTRYGGLTGRLLVRLPQPLPVNQDFEADAVVYYPIYSVWKTGSFVRMNFTGHFSPDNPASTGETTNEIPGGGKMKFKGVAENQTVEYAAVIDANQRVVTGGYLSKHPDDYGTFWLEQE